jgi:hypothetical protein
MAGDGTPNRQNKVTSSCQIVHILQTIILPLDRCIHMDFENIVHEGRCRQDFVILDHVKSKLVS